jgi:hypothetical protein
MYFPRDDCPIFLMTDACDYGIGAYCYQLVDNNEQSVALVSKSLNDTQVVHITEGGICDILRP